MFIESLQENRMPAMPLGEQKEEEHRQREGVCGSVWGSEGEKGGGGGDGELHPKRPTTAMSVPAFVVKRGITWHTQTRVALPSLSLSSPVPVSSFRLLCMWGIQER